MSILDRIRGDSTLLAAIQDSVMRTLQVHTHSKIEIDPTFFRSSADTKNLGVIGLVRIEGNAAPAFLAIGFSETAFLQIYKNMFMDQFKLASLAGMTGMAV